MQEDSEATIELTTVCVDIYGKVYDLRFEHPSWEQAKAGKGKRTFERCIVKDAFTWPISLLEDLRKKKGKR